MTLIEDFLTDLTEMLAFIALALACLAILSRGSYHSESQAEGMKAGHSIPS